LLTIKSTHYDYKVSFINNINESISNLIIKGRTSFLIDKNVWALYSNELYLQDYLDDVYFVTAVEDHKTIYDVIDILKIWQVKDIQKKSRIIIFGGGITQDIGAFACKIYYRGIDWYFFPTTLLAMSDSCIGAKCGVNFNNFKNQLGVFHAPKEVYIYIPFIETLKIEDIYSGLGEIFKLHISKDAEHYNYCKKSFEELGNLKAYIKQLVYQSLKIKKEIIELDEYDTGIRRILNYGHTFGHALEKYTNNEISHGIAVLWGMDISNYISYQLHYLSEKDYLDIKNVIKTTFNLKCPYVTDIDKLLQVIKRDKKSESDFINMVLLTKIGNLKLEAIALDKNLKKILKDYFDESLGFFSN